MKNVVSGKVMNQASGVGLADLEVAVYDMDPLRLRELFAEQTVPTDEVGRLSLQTGDDPVTPFPLDLTTGLPENFTLVRALSPAARAWLDLPGDRLGSVLTDAGGRFALSYDDEAFNIRETEKRPDLVLFVLGPDRNLGVPVLERLLHFSFVVRGNAGRQESYVIQIPEERLDTTGVPRASGQGPDLERIFGGIRAPENAERRSARNDFRHHMGTMLAPDRLATNPRYVARGAAPADVTTVEQSAIATGIARVAEARLRAPIVYLSEELQARFPSGETISACDVLEAKGLDVALTRVRRLIDEEKAMRAADGLTDAPDGETGEGSTDAETPLIDATEGLDFVTSRILGQVSNLPEYSNTETRGVIDDLATIKDRINKLEMSSGPTNVTAFRDFHSLQIAFPDVWTAAFDSALEEDVLALYETVNEINEDYGVVFPRIDDVADITEFEDYIASLTGDLADEGDGYRPIPDNVAAAFPALKLEQWNRLSAAGQDRLMRGVRQIDSEDFMSAEEKRWQRDRLLHDVMHNPGYQTSISRLKRLFSDIGEKLSTPYSFRYYKEGSVNYALLLNYRQEWTPANYQVGRLVSTLPLAPGQSIELKLTQKTKLTRAEKEVRKALTEASYERSSSTRSELDVLAKLSTTSNFQMSAQGTFSFGVGSIQSASQFSHNQQAESSRQHKQIAEATRKASEKVRQEREVSIERKDESEVSSETTQKISNPNNEVTVTYLMYELERRYRVSQRLHEVTPVIMVALDMPSPHELTEGWILEHAWILRRVLLDDALEEAIDLIEFGRQADAVELSILRATYERERESLSRIETDLDAIIADRATLRESIINLQEQKYRFEAGEDSTEDKVRDFFLSGGFSLFGRRSGPDQGELFQAGIAAAESRLEYIDARAEELGARQRAAKREAREAARLYSAALKLQARNDTLVKQLQLHLRQNIFHYLHAVWEMRHPDELFFTFAEMEVYHIGQGTARCRLQPAPAGSGFSLPGITRSGGVFEMVCDPPVPPDFSDPENQKVPLGEIAHVDRLLGFKGNYAIFPLKTCSHLTDFMMSEFVDDYLGLRDPARELGVGAAEMIDYARAIWTRDELSGSDREALERIVTDMLSDANEDVQDITLPTGQIYMEALKGEQTLLEDFKLAHRGMDVVKVQEEIRTQRLESLRRAARMVQEEPEFGDPDIDKNITVRGDPGDLDIDV